MSDMMRKAFATAYRKAIRYGKQGGSGAVGLAAPSVSIAGASSVNEGAEIVLTATITPGSGAVVDIRWSRISGPAQESASGRKTAVCTVTAPAVSADSVMVWQCLVTDENGLTGYASTSFTIIDVLPVLTGASFLANSVQVTGPAELQLTFVQLPPSVTTSLSVTLTPESSLSGPSGATSLDVASDADGFGSVLVPYVTQTVDASATCSAAYRGVTLSDSIEVTAPPAAVDVIDDDFTGTAGTTVLSRTSEGWSVVAGAAGSVADSWVLDASGQASWSPSGGDTGAVGTATIGCNVTDAPGVRLKWKHVTLGSCRFHLFASDQSNGVIVEISGAGSNFTIRNLVAGVTTTAGTIAFGNSDGGGAALASGDVFEVRLLRSGNTITDQAVYRNGVRIMKAVTWAWSSSLVLGTICGRSTRSRSGVEDDIKIGPVESVALPSDPAFTAAAFSPASVSAGVSSALVLSFSGLAASSTVSVPVTLTPSGGLTGTSGATNLNVTTNALGVGSVSVNYSAAAAGSYSVSVLSQGTTRAASLAVTAAVNAAPTVSIAAPFTVTEGSSVTLTATASDTDGTIASYVWSQTAGPTATVVSGAGTAVLVVTAPAVTTDTAMTWQCTVTDDDGANGSASRSVTVVDAAGTSDPTWSAAGLLWANCPPTYEYSASRLFANADLHSRNFAPLDNEYSYTARVTCGAEGWPVNGTSFARIFLASMLPSDVGDYLFEFAGTAASLTTYSGCTISEVVVGGGKTTGKITIGASASTGGIKFNNVTGFSGLKIMRPGLALTYSGLLRPDAATHLATFSGLRFLDLLETNDSTEAIEADWSTARASKGLDPVGYKHSLKACFDIAAVNGQDAWVLVPATASDAHMASFVGACASLRASGQRVVIEFSNERWNSGFKAWGYCGIAACDAANTRTGNPGQTGRILSAVRAGNVVTVVFNSAHGITAGTTIYRGGLTGLASGAVVVASTPNATTITWAETGDDATATLATSFNSYIHLNLSHSLTARLTAWGNPNTYPTAYVVKERWETSRLKVIYDAIVAAGQAANIKAVMGASVGTATTPGILAWAKQTYGSTAWIDSVAPAYYAYPASSTAMTTVDAVFQQLEEGLPAKLASLLRQRNGAKTFGVRMTAYEGGPHTHLKPNDTVNAAIAAAHVDDRMRLLARRLLDEFRAIGADEFVWFAAGAAASFGGTGNNTWPLVLGNLSDGPNQAKFKAMIEQAAASSIPTPRDGQTWGAIALGTYLAVDIGGLGAAPNRVIGTTEVFGDLPLFVSCPVAGTYTLELRACQSTAAGQWVTVLVDGVVVADQVILPVQTPTSSGTLPVAVSVPVTMARGGQDVTIRLRKDARAASIGLGTLTLS